jgi:hypothetical protein
MFCPAPNQSAVLRKERTYVFERWQESQGAGHNIEKATSIRFMVRELFQSR